MLLLAFGSPPIQVDSLTCERRTDPLGVDAATPRLAWILHGQGRNRRQAAFQIRAGTKPGGDDLWDSRRVRSDESAGMPYVGHRLGSSKTVYWQVRVWDQDGHVSPWSRAAKWTNGVLNRRDWKARWIGYNGQSPTDSLLLRREFAVHSGLRSALLHVTGLGQVEMWLNGRRVGDSVLTPGWSAYDKTVLYNTYDVKPLLNPGTNAAGILLGNGMYNVHAGRYTKFVGPSEPQCAIAQLELTYRDGHVETIGTSSDWSAHAGPITFSSVYGGEDYDLRLEPKGWMKPGFAGRWPKAAVMPGPGGVLRADLTPPIKAFQTFNPKSIKLIGKSIQVFDLGQNASMMVRLTALGPPGSAVKVTPAELVNPDGTVDRRSVGGGEAYWKLTLNGSRASYASHFFYQGARYFQVELMPDEKGHRPTLEGIEGTVVHSSAPEVGEFVCSNELFNRIHRLIRWAQESNTVSLLTDCPHRERLGWLEQYHLNGPSLRYEHDLANLFDKCVQDMQDSQCPDGLVPDIAPEYTVFNGGFRDSPEWGSSIVLVPWQQYQWNRDLGLLARSYGSMKRYVEYLRSKSRNGIVEHGLGDWYDLGPRSPGFAQLTPRPFTATAFYYQDAKILAQIAGLLGKKEDAASFQNESEAVKAAFNRTYFDPAEGYYSTGSQTASAIPLVMGLVEQPHRASVLAQLVRDIRSRGNAFTAGDVGYRYVLRALADAGRSDVVFAMNNQSVRPGYGYQLAKGATSLTEAWNADPTSSQDHFMLGQLMEWFYHDLAGIQPVDGFHRFAICPSTVKGLNWVKASYCSEYGLIESSWRRKGKALVFEITIPANSSAEIRLPGSAVDEASSVQMGKGFTLGSGRYRLRVKDSNQQQNPF